MIMVRLFYKAEGVFYTLNSLLIIRFVGADGIVAMWV